MTGGHEPPLTDAARPAGPERRPADVAMEAIAGSMRNALGQLAESLGEDVIGGHRHPRTNDVTYRISTLRVVAQDRCETLRAGLKEWSAGPYSGRVPMLLCLWAEAWHLLDYSLAYRSLAVVRRAAAAICREAVAAPAQEYRPGPVQDWEVRAVPVIGWAMSLVTMDAYLFKLINLSSTEGLKAAAARGAAACTAIAAAFEALGPPPAGAGPDGWTAGADAGRWITARLDEIRTTAVQNSIFYAVLTHAAGALTDFEQWLAGAPRVTSEQAAGAGAGRLSPHTAETLASIGAALGHLRAVQATISDWMIRSRYEPWERLLVQIGDIVRAGTTGAARRVFVPDRVSVRYLYPFAIESAERAGDRLDSETADHFFAQLKADLGRQLGAIGITVGEPKALEPTQFFTRGSGLYGGVRVDLPDLELNLPGPAGSGGPRPQLQAWLNLSSMGNHCLCVDLKGDLVQPLPHVLYRALRAGTPFAAGATVTVPRGPGLPRTAWDNLHLFSRDVITAVAGAAFWGVAEDLHVTQRFIRGNLHEILVVRTEGPLGARPPEITRVLDRAVGGRILARSIQRAAATLEEWVRYPPVPRTAGLDGAPTLAGIPEMGLAGDWCTHTGETTVFGIVSAPSWHSDVYVEGAQFANSWPPRLQLWSRRLRSTVETLEQEDDHARGSEQLRQVERRVRLHLAQISTEELTATLAHRRFLDQLLGMAGLGRLQADLQGELEAAERLTDWFNQKVYQSNEERHRAEAETRERADARRQVLLGFIALFGLFELGTFLSLADSTHFRVGSLSFSPAQGSWQDWVVIGLFIVAVPVGLYFLNSHVEGLVKKLRSRPGKNENHGGHT